jgi:UDP-N-acetylmuramoyl-tripeptide--D-alanyl-D-alanine ligase
LQEAARFGVRRWNGSVIAVTGSAGKTSSKDAIAHLLSGRFRTGKTVGNFNNHFGLPLSILRLPDNATHAVLEMGMNHAGEIRDLARIARPRVGVVTNVGYAHVENFESIEDIALAKRELIEELPDDGLAVLNADDERVARFGEVFNGRKVTYGLGESAAVRATDVETTVDGSRFEVDGIDFKIPLPGVHNVRNVLAAIAVGRYFGVPEALLRQQASTLTAGRMRGERLEVNGVTIWNDCYNANPEAVRSMIEVLLNTPGSRRIAVLGEMLELGAVSERLHREIGAYIAASGIDVLVGVCGAARELVDSAIAAGQEAYFFDDPKSAGDYVKELVRPGDVVLFKGSRGVRVERAMERLLEAAVK